MLILIILLNVFSQALLFIFTVNIDTSKNDKNLIVVELCVLFGYLLCYGSSLILLNWL